MQLPVPLTGNPAALKRPVDKPPLAVWPYTDLLVTRAQEEPVPPGFALTWVTKFAERAKLAEPPVAVLIEFQFVGA